MYSSRVIEAYKTITVNVDLGEGKILDVTIPFDVQLMQRVEDTIIAASARPWWRTRPSEKNAVQAFEDFCRPYLPDDLDFTTLSPTFCALFFSSVRDEFNRSFSELLNSTPSMAGSSEHTESVKTKDVASE